jgi:nucleotide-binding universal stress UspA family protein
MKQLKKILVPTDLTERSRRALTYGCWLADDGKSELVVLHVTSELNAWELYSEDALFIGLNNGKVWPLDRVLAEASLDLNRFLEPHLAKLKELRSVTKRVVLGTVADRINSVAEEERADLVIMSPRRDRGLRHWLSASITEQVTRMSPCPVLSITPPLPSEPWRKQLMPYFFGWPRQSAAPL